MKNKSKLILLISLFTMIISLSACSSSKKDEASAAVTTWGDAYTTLMESGKESEHESFKQLQKILNDVRTNSGATYSYVIMPISNEKASLDGDAKGDFMLTIDGSEVPEDWGVVYHNEIQFTEAWEGKTSAARSAWDDGDNQCWSAFSPVYNSKGKIVCLLGIDYPATELITKYPEWNRNSDSWNGYTDEISGEIPQEVQQKIDEVKSIVEKYAKELSTNSL